MTLFLYIVACFVLIGSVIETARILAVFPVASISHQVVFRPLTQELARRGHEVVVITPDAAFPRGKSPPNLTEIDVHDISYKTWQDHYTATTPVGNKENLREQAVNVANILVLLVEQHFKHEEVLKMINDKQKTFDLLLLEGFARPALIYSHIYKVPVIHVNSFGAIFGNYEAVGAPTHPLLYPLFTRQKLANLTIWDKVMELYNHYYMQRVMMNDDFADKIFKKLLGPEVSPLSKLVENVHMLFLNVHPVFYGIQPVPPSVVYMGGLHQNEEKDLPSDLKSYLDSSKNGVIYFSFGTNVDVSFLPPEKIQTFIRVLSQLPYDVLWKWNEDEMPGRTSNIRISKWFPQSDLLRHPKIKLFITQGGLQSTDEAITAGVPLIGIPMLGDQWFNVEKYVQHGIGIKLDINSLNDDNFRNSIETVINDESYRQNVLRLRSILNDQPQHPLDRAVWWTEYVIRHGGARDLRGPAANIAWAEYLELELVLTVLLILMTTFVGVTISLYCLCTRIKRMIVKKYYSEIREHKKSD